MWSEIKIAWRRSCWPRYSICSNEFSTTRSITFRLMTSALKKTRSHFPSSPRHVTFRVHSLRKLRKLRTRWWESSGKIGFRKAEKFSSPSSCRCFRCIAGLLSDRKSSDIYFKNEKKRFMRATGAENFDLILFSNFENVSNFADFGTVECIKEVRSFASPRDKCTLLMTSAPADIEQ